MHRALISVLLAVISLPLIAAAYVDGTIVSLACCRRDRKHAIAVRRTSAISLLVALCFSLIAPALSADPESTLPECCRRKGIHHCTMGTPNKAPTDQPAFRMIQRCPSCPQALAVTADTVAAVPRNSGPVFASLASHSSIQRQTEVHYRVSFSRSRQKRGPPALLS